MCNLRKALDLAVKLLVAMSNISDKYCTENCCYSPVKCIIHDCRLQSSATGLLARSK